MMRDLCLAALVTTALAGCGAAQSAEHGTVADSNPGSANHWKDPMTEASDRMTAEANRTKLGKGVQGRRKESIDAWYDRSGEDEGAPVDAPDSGW